MKYRQLNGFNFGETGYGFNEDDELYAHTYDEDTWNMDYLFKTREEAILNKIKQTEEFIEELKEMLSKLKEEKQK